MSEYPRYRWEGNSHVPDDLPEEGNRCKYCGLSITWIGPGRYDWELADEVPETNRPAVTHNKVAAPTGLRSRGRRLEAEGTA
ncbi:hypothetical protein SAMN05216215_1018156 [Saccharopolyspora shandongensis]|uniref:Uncharacterized protein n=1 Tax=Saccharopolyspora shandongensis TaxID=418495 RepID=A0A1H3GG21_9PSEU|nr:hypothetical protein SAMN05216215_1018156 [Saccharopolyspora shandongensis]